MPLSAELQRALDEAYAAVQQQPDHALIPFYRHEIYKAISPAIYNKLGELIDPHAYRVRVTLSLLTGERLLPIWRSARPDDPWPENLLVRVEDVMRGLVDPKLARDEAEAAFERAAELASIMEEPHLQRIWAVAAFAIEALFEAGGRRGFGSSVRSQHDTDADLDPWTSDPAMWAAIAYAGAIWNPDSDPMKRKEFWEWWLQEAIPAAWTMQSKM